MGKVRLGFYSSDEEYAGRLTNFLMKYYREKLELCIYTEKEPVLSDPGSSWEVLLLSDDPELLQECMNRNPEKIRHVFYLKDNIREKKNEMETVYAAAAQKGVGFLDKYQDVNRIVDEILKKIGNEVKEFQLTGKIPGKVEILAVYSLSENECQLPLAVTLSSLLGECRKVLMIDLQENSGISQLVDCEQHGGLEDLLVMACGGQYSERRLNGCIGHLGKADFVYPLRSSENLCEADYGVYQKMLELIGRETDYDILVLNLGSRFQGFFEVLGMCRRIYLMQKRNGLAQWREKEFLKELRTLKQEYVEDRIIHMELPPVPSTASSCESLVEQWKWNEMGDMIRAHTPEVKMVG